MAWIAVPVIGLPVSPIISKVLEHAILHSQDRWRLGTDVEKEIDHLRKELPRIRGLLEEAEKKQLQNSGVLSWLGQLKQVLLDAEDILDRYEVALALMDEIDAEQQVRRLNFSLLSSRRDKRDKLHRRVAEQIRKTRKRLDHELQQGLMFGLLQRVADEQRSSTRAGHSRVTTSFLHKNSTVVGREAEKRAIIDKLLVDSEKLLVLPIVGMGGVGKTTLAKLVFHDTAVDVFFKSKLWLPIGMSPDLDLERLTIQIFDFICAPEKKIQNRDFYSLDQWQKGVVEEMKQKTPFLLVLDDAWDTKRSSWTTFLEPLIVSEFKCRIIVTTRAREVVDALGNEKVNGHRLEPIQLNLLEEDDMWSIFSSHAFGSESVDIDPQLKSIGKQIVSRLGGLPLAAEVAGGILRESRDARDWKMISKSKLLEIKDENNDMPSVLMLSYDKLPLHLKQCFLYFSLFPKDCTFVSEDYTFVSKGYTFVSRNEEFANPTLSYIWMSQRLMDTENGIASADSGSKILVQLLNRSLLQGDVSRFTMHNLVHDLVEKIAQEEFLCVSSATEKIDLPKKLRHISFIQENSDTEETSELELKMLWDIKECQTLRTLLFFKFDERVSNFGPYLTDCFKSLIHLRALALHNKYLTSLPDSIGNLKLLRYLDLNLPRMEKLPDSVCRLYSLQVLVLVGCDRLSVLDVSLTRLVNLVNLDIREDMPTVKNIGRLTNLQQLRALHIKGQNGHTVRELRNLKKICGSLHILNLENIEGKREAEEAELHRKGGLQKLKFSWGKASGPKEELQLDVLEELRPNPNLNKLTLNGYMGTHLPKWLDDMCLPCLIAIKLHDCLKLRVIPFLIYGLRKLEICDSPRLVEMPSLPPRLRCLRLSGVGVTSLFPSSSPSLQSLPSIETLSVRACRNLDESLSALLKGSLPSLSSLDISDYSHPLEALCYLTALSELHLSHCSGDVGVDVGALLSLKHLRVEDCPHAIIERSPTSAPSTSLSDLEIRRSPLLLFTLHQSQVSLASLSSLTIHGDDLDDSLLSGCLHGLSALETLVMRKCPNVTSIPNEVLLTLVSLETLSISRCETLEELDLLALSSLQWLEIESCPRLVFDRPQPQPDSSSSGGEILEDVRLCDFRAEQAEGLLSLLATCANVKNVSLLSYEIRFTSGLGDICMLTRLQELAVTRCEGLPSIFPSLQLLERLSIESCPDVTSLPALNSLRSLTLRDCPNVTFSESPSLLFPSLAQLKLGGFSVRQLTHLLARVTKSPLRRLLIEGCDDLISFDGGLEVPLLSLTSLRELEISRCVHMLRLPSSLRELRALRGLTISGCSRISSLPEEGLPVSLESLRVVRCPALEAWCARRDGYRRREQRMSRNPFLEFEREPLPSSLFWPN